LTVLFCVLFLSVSDVNFKASRRQKRGAAMPLMRGQSITFQEIPHILGKAGHLHRLAYSNLQY